MSNDLSPDYFLPSLGSISGFSSVNLPTNNPDLAEVGWSIDQIKAFLLNESDLNFPSPDFLIQLEDRIRAHLGDYNNPHHVTLDQIAGDFVDQVLGIIVAGTAPTLVPFFAFDASNALPLGDIFPATYTTSNFYRVSEGGGFINPANEVEIIGTDYTQKLAGIPLFSGVINSVPNDWASEDATPLNTTLLPNTFSNTTFPFQFFVVAETDASGNFGVNIPATQVQNSGYTFTAYFLPIAGGKLIFSQPGAPNSTMTVDTTDGSFVLSNDSVQGSVTVDTTGILRISFSVISLFPVPADAVQVVHQNVGDTSPVRLGQVGRNLFAIGRPYMTQSTRNHPMLIDQLSQGSTSEFVLNLNRIPVPSLLPEVTITLSLDLWPKLPGATAPDPWILRFDNLTITRDQTNIYFQLNNTTVFASAILEGLNIVSVSYSPTEFIVKDLANPRQTLTGTFPPLSTTSVIIGRCAGYLRSCAMYAQADKLRCLEFLTNG